MRKRKSSGGCVHVASLRSRCDDHTACIYFSRPAKTLAALFVAQRRHQSVGLQFPRCHCHRHALQILILRLSCCESRGNTPLEEGESLGCDDYFENNCFIPLENCVKTYYFKSFFFLSTGRNQDTHRCFEFRSV